MKCLCRPFAILFLAGFFAASSQAQTPSPPVENSSGSDLLALTKKIDEQNTKIDALSQQILHLQQEIEQSKGTPTRAATAVESATPIAGETASGSTHVVARGETLTSIAKMHKVSIGELQQFNHIADDRKLQIGQTLVIPGAQTATPAVSPSATTPPNE
jgi:LysM repeat protein